MKAYMLQYYPNSAREIYPNSPLIQKELRSLIQSSQVWYPRICDWYRQKFVPGLGNGSRKILIYVVDNEVAGIAFLKDEAKEKKICTLRVRDKYQNNGIGKTLLERCVEILGTDKPMITVPEERLYYFCNLFKHYDFKLEQVTHNYYRNNSSEYVFNGSLDSAKK